MSYQDPSHDQDVVNMHDPPRRKGWFGRNWIWFVPLLLVAVVAPIAVCCGTGGYFFMGVMKAPLDAAVAELNRTPEVTERLGSPVTAGSRFGVSNLNSTNGNGQATISLNVTGPEGSGQLEGEMLQTAGKWRVGDLRLTTTDGTVIRITDAEGATVVKDNDTVQVPADDPR